MAIQRPKKHRVRAFVDRIDSLFLATLIGSQDDNAHRKAVSRLRLSGSKLVFQRAEAWSRSSTPLKRARAATVLAQLQILHRRPWKSEKIFVEEIFAIVTALIAEEADIHARSCELFALGHLDDARGVPILVSFAKHHDADIRYAVAVALGNYSEDPSAVKALLELMDDPDRDVRDWAIFGLGTLGRADSEEIRNALFSHLRDPYVNAREEAAVALALRGDQRMIRSLIDLLKKDRDRILLLEAAREFLEMDCDPPDWFEAEYVAALEAKFPEMPDALV